MTSYGYIIIMTIVDSCMIWFNFDCVMQYKKSYHVATNVCSRRSATTFGDLPDWWGPRAMCSWSNAAVTRLNTSSWKTEKQGPINPTKPISWLLQGVRESAVMAGNHYEQCRHLLSRTNVMFSFIKIDAYELRGS